MKKKNNLSKSKRIYQAPEIEQVKLDTEISLVMTSPPNDPWASPQNPSNTPGGFIQRVIRII